MAVPKRKVSRSKGGMRRSHSALKPLNLIKNKETGVWHMPHCVSPDGLYKGKKVLDKKKMPKYLKHITG